IVGNDPKNGDWMLSDSRGYYMNLQRRIQIAWVTLWSAKFRFWGHLLLLRPVVLISNSMVAVYKKRAHYRIERLKKEFTSNNNRIRAFIEEYRAIAPSSSELTEAYRVRLFTTRSALLAENERLQSSAAELVRGRPPGWATVLNFILM